MCGRPGTGRGGGRGVPAPFSGPGRKGAAGAPDSKAFRGWARPRLRSSSARPPPFPDGRPQGRPPPGSPPEAIEGPRPQVKREGAFIPVARAGALFLNKRFQRPQACETLSNLSTLFVWASGPFRNHILDAEGLNLNVLERDENRVKWRALTAVGPTPPDF